MSLLQSPDVKNGEVRGEAGGKSEEGNGVASPPSSLFFPKFSTGRLASATVDHSSLSAGIREERRASNFCQKEDQGFTAWMTQLRSFGCKTSST